MTENERIKYKDEIERIDSLSLDMIYKMNACNLGRLTDEFEDSLVRLIFAKTRDIDEQRSLVRFLGEAFEEYGIYKGDNDYYFDDLSYEIDCNRIITENGVVPAPSIVPAETTLKNVKLGSSTLRPSNVRETYTTSKARLKRISALNLLSSSVEEIIERKMDDYLKMRSMSFKDIDVACPDDDNGTNGLVKVLQDRVRELEQETLDLQAEIDRLKELSEAVESVEDITWHDKVRLDLLLRLLKKDGANLGPHGNKTKAAKVMNMITKLPLQTCKNYCSDPKLSIEEHKEEILQTNTYLQALEMEIRL